MPDRFEDYDSTDEKSAADLARELDPPERDDPTPADLAGDDEPATLIGSLGELVDDVRKQNIVDKPARPYSSGEAQDADLARKLDHDARLDVIDALDFASRRPEVPESARLRYEGLARLVERDELAVVRTQRDELDERRTRDELDERDRALTLAVEALRYYGSHAPATSSTDAADELADELERGKVDVLFGLTESGLRAMWARRESELVRDGVPEVECYPRGAERDGKLARRLLDDGLLYLVNALVLHPVGLALGITHASAYEPEEVGRGGEWWTGDRQPVEGSAPRTAPVEKWRVIDRRHEVEPGVYKSANADALFDTREQALAEAHELARVDTDPDPYRVAELFIIRTDDPEGFSFELLDHELGLAKLDKAMLKALSHHLSEYAVRYVERELVRRERDRRRLEQGS